MRKINDLPLPPRPEPGTMELSTVDVTTGEVKTITIDRQKLWDLAAESLRLQKRRRTTKRWLSRRLNELSKKG